MGELSSLPTEVLREVLRYLPIPSLFAFGQTSKYNHAVQEISLTSLGLGVFPNRVQSLLSLMDEVEDSVYTHSVQIILEKRRSRSKDMVIKNQNSIVQKIVNKHQRTLRVLEVAIWDMCENSAKSISQLHGLQHLSVRLDHPNMRHPDLDRMFWKTSPGSTVWNQFYLQDRGHKAFGRLESLRLERVGITDWQLQNMIENNPKITCIRLQKCCTLSSEFFEFLAGSRVGSQLKVLCFTHSHHAEIDERILQHICKLSSLEALSFYACSNIPTARAQELNNQEWRITKFTPPCLEQSSMSIEIDPAYK